MSRFLTSDFRASCEAAAVSTPDIPPVSLRLFRGDDLSVALAARYFYDLDLDQIGSFTGQPAGSAKSANDVLWNSLCGYRNRGIL